MPHGLSIELSRIKKPRWRYWLRERLYRLYRRGDDGRLIRLEPRPVKVKRKGRSYGRIARRVMNKSAARCRMALRAAELDRIWKEWGPK